MVRRQLIRESLDLQVQLADKLQISQGNVSELEHRRELYLSTLREYVEALGEPASQAARSPGLRHVGR